MDSARCIEVFGEGGFYGSGYALTSTHVLTALHVLNKRDSARVRLLKAWASNKAKHPARVIWKSEDLDVALLELVERVTGWEGLALPEFGAVVGDAVHSFTACGFPMFRKDEDSRDTY